ncbi:RNA polymerase sigma factor [Heliorestis convoluta]|uniref:Sigma-70 family RNA polymerase sigma factor n=1 Tax=Heliorestis convoluta TaxID=356322 RepID=A0A5Q2N1G9_9FIRM|nr:hypothetical protein [Heliorestis convoluta]QGG47669.1 hypothetical protein FTV88_1569 [Heliorestis convoluta]
MDLDKELDQLALQFNKTGDENAFNQLFEKMKPIVRKQALKYHYSTGIAVEEYESIFAEEVWKAAIFYDGTSRFLQRFYFHIKSAQTDLYRYHKSQKRSLYKEESIDVENGDIVLDQVAIQQTSTEQEYLDCQEVEKKIHDFERTNERHGKVIKLLNFGCSNQDIAGVFGRNKYDSTVRNIVNRAKEKFKKYLIETVS